MGDVIDFPTDKDPTAEGEAICRSCKHIWEAVVPSGTFWFECPNCNERKGVFRNVFGALVGEYEYRCLTCTGTDFYIRKKTLESVGEVRCRGCGLEHTGWFE